MRLTADASDAQDASRIARDAWSPGSSSRLSHAQAYVAASASGRRGADRNKADGRSAGRAAVRTVKLPAGRAHGTACASGRPAGRQVAEPIQEQAARLADRRLIRPLADSSVGSVAQPVVGLLARPVGRRSDGQTVQFRVSEIVRQVVCTSVG